MVGTNGPGSSKVTTATSSDAPSSPLAGHTTPPAPTMEKSALVKRFSLSSQKLFTTVTLFRPILGECVFDLESMPEEFLVLIHKHHLELLCTHNLPYNSHLVKELYANFPTKRVNPENESQTLSVLCRGKTISLNVAVIENFFGLPPSTQEQADLLWKQGESVPLSDINAVLFRPDKPVKPKCMFYIAHMTPLGRCLCYLLKSNVFPPTNKSRLPKALVGMAYLLITSSEPLPVARWIFYSILHAGVYNFDDKSKKLVFPSLLTALAIRERCSVFDSDIHISPLIVNTTTFKKSDAASSRKKHDAIPSHPSSDQTLHAKLDAISALLQTLSGITQNLVSKVAANQSSIIAIQNLLVDRGLNTDTSPHSSPLISLNNETVGDNVLTDPEDTWMEDEPISSRVKKGKRKTPSHDQINAVSSPAQRKSNAPRSKN